MENQTRTLAFIEFLGNFFITTKKFINVHDNPKDCESIKILERLQKELKTIHEEINKNALS
ncbi:MAG: hypothetical protein FWD97_01315 [Defluviitaleaceae bacterium]|nr:hypothetical protein [Defluviitaleaceae bacterium]